MMNIIVNFFFIYYINLYSQFNYTHFKCCQIVSLFQFVYIYSKKSLFQYYIQLITINISFNFVFIPKTRIHNIYIWGKPDLNLL